MLRLLLDTNIFGLIVDDEERAEILEGLKSSKEILVYAPEIVRKELRATSGKTPEDKRFRIRLLNAFDIIVQDDRILRTTAKIQELAEKYFFVYDALGGKSSRKDIINDFIIVATASVNNLDILSSEDRKTMLESRAIKAYTLVNRVKCIKLPRIISYLEFKKLIRRSFS
jgi:predicted nucleic acid-binding protein